MKLVEEIVWAAKFASSLRDGYRLSLAAERAHADVEALRALRTEDLNPEAQATLLEIRGK